MSILISFFYFKYFYNRRAIVKYLDSSIYPNIFFNSKLLSLPIILYKDKVHFLINNIDTNDNTLFKNILNIFVIIFI